MQNWQTVYNVNNVNESYNNFIEIFLHLYSLSCPIRHCKLKNNNKTWFTNGLKNACRKKNILYVKFKTNPTLHIENKYKKYENKLTNIIRNCEKQFYSIELQKTENNIRGTWKVLNKILSKNKDDSKNRLKCKFDGETVFNTPKEIVNGFNKYFTEAGQRLSSNISSGSGNIYDYLNRDFNNSMYLQNCTEQEVLKIVNTFKNKKSMDTDGLGMNLVKKVINNIIKPLTYICNKSFQEGGFQDNMKISKIIQILKYGDNSILSNYRPISLLSQFSKILEKLFERRLSGFLEKNLILTNSQYGFRHNRSTLTALVQMTEKIVSSLDAECSTIAIFIDLQKAFDTIDHDILIEKLENIGIRGIVLEWLQSYLRKTTICGI